MDGVTQAASEQLAAHSQFFSAPVEIGIGCLLAACAAMLIAFFWTHSGYDQSMGATVVFGLITTTGVGVLAGWNAPYVGTIHGLSWVVGFSLSTHLTRRVIIRDHSTGLEHLPSRSQNDFRAFVSCTVFSKDREAASRAIKAKRQSLVKEHDSRERAGAAALHDVIHCARDEAVLLLAANDKLIKELVAVGQDGLFLQHLSTEFEVHLRNVLQKVLRLFEIVTGQKDLWVALRILDKQGGSQVYRTLSRVGKVTDDRRQRTSAVPETVGLPAFLRSEYDAGRGIVILGKSRKKSQWIKTPNDCRKEDASVMAGPIIIKTVASGVEKKEMLMILYVNSPTEGCFAEYHKDFLRCCTDTLSLYLSLALQVQPRIRLSASGG